MFRLALNAGHYLGTPGKRCLKELDPKETREWVLNSRIADLVEMRLQSYTGYELVRTDDATGQKNITLANRVKTANNFKADFYLSIHHNAGIDGGDGGGICVYTYTNPLPAATQWQQELYAALIDKTGLKGNRANPLPRANLQELRETTMPAVILELGFMDSRTDVPVILTDAYAQQCAEAIVDILIRRGNLQKREEKLCRVQVGAFSKKENAEALVRALRGDGYEAVIL